MFTRSDLEAAAEFVHARMAPTPQHHWPLLSEAVGAEVWVKHENHTPTGAFKVRGALTFMDWLTRTHPDVPGICTATRGNHGQGQAWAATNAGLRALVYVPRGNSVEKNAAMRAFGAELVEFGDDFDTARLEAYRVADQEGLFIVPPYHPELVRGVATYGAELFSDVPALDVVYVPIGMGSGACSLIAVRDLLGSRADIVGVVSDAADAVARSMAAGRVVTTNSALTFADGMATRIPHPDAFAVMQAGLARVVAVSDDEVAEAMRLLYRTTHNVAEGAGAAATAAALKEAKAGVVEGKRCAAILTGGNIDRTWFSQVLAGETPTV